MAKAKVETRIAVIETLPTGKDFARYTAPVTEADMDVRVAMATARIDAITARGGVARIETFTHTVSA